MLQGFAIFHLKTSQTGRQSALVFYVEPLRVSKDQANSL